MEYWIKNNIIRLKENKSETTLEQLIIFMCFYSYQKEYSVHEQWLYYISAAIGRMTVPSVSQSWLTYFADQTERDRHSTDFINEAEVRSLSTCRSNYTIPPRCISLCICVLARNTKGGKTRWVITKENVWRINWDEVIRESLFFYDL